MPSDMLVALEDIVHGFGRSTEEWTYELPLVLHPAMNILEAKPTCTLDTSQTVRRPRELVDLPNELAIG